jgi:hypothetical protein
MKRQTKETVKSLEAKLDKFAMEFSPDAVMLDKDSGHISMSSEVHGTKVIYAPSDNPVVPIKRIPFTHDQQQWNRKHGRDPLTGRKIR